MVLDEWYLNRNSPPNLRDPVPEIAWTAQACVCVCVCVWQYVSMNDVINSKLHSTVDNTKTMIKVVMVIYTIHSLKPPTLTTQDGWIYWAKKGFHIISLSQLFLQMDQQCLLTLFCVMAVLPSPSSSRVAASVKAFMPSRGRYSWFKVTSPPIWASIVLTTGRTHG